MKIAVDMDSTVQSFWGLVLPHLVADGIVGLDFRPPVEGIWWGDVLPNGQEFGDYLYELSVRAYGGMRAWPACGQAEPWAIYGLRSLEDRGHEIHIVTDRGMLHEGRSSTAAWLRSHMIFPTSIILTGDKASVDCDIIIDDKPDLVQSYFDTDRFGMVHAQPWNADTGLPRGSWLDFLEIVNMVESVEEMREFLS